MKDNHRFRAASISQNQIRFIQTYEYTGTTASKYGLTQAGLSFDSSPKFNREQLLEVEKE